jgi:hypothetical protein
MEHDLPLSTGFESLHRRSALLRARRKPRSRGPMAWRQRPSDDWRRSLPRASRFLLLAATLSNKFPLGRKRPLVPQKIRTPGSKGNALMAPRWRPRYDCVFRHWGHGRRTRRERRASANDRRRRVISPPRAHAFGYVPELLRCSCRFSIAFDFLSHCSDFVRREKDAARQRRRRHADSQLVRVTLRTLTSGSGSVPFFHGSCDSTPLNDSWTFQQRSALADSYQSFCWHFRRVRLSFGPYSPTNQQMFDAAKCRDCTCTPKTPADRVAHPKSRHRRPRTG